MRTARTRQSWFTTRFGFDRRSVWNAALVVGVEVALVWLYFQLTAAIPGSIRHLVYPFIWINVGGWATYRTFKRRQETEGARRRLFVAAFAAGYGFLLLAVSGNITFPSAGASETGLDVSWLVPGWGPLLTYGGSTVQLYLVPFQVVGYLSLAYLLYAHVLNATRRASAGLLGVFTCTGCAAPVLAQTLAVFGGASGVLTPLIYGWAYDVGTLMFVMTVGILYASYEYSAR